MFICLMLQNFYLPVVPHSGQFTVNLLQSVDQDEHLFEHSLHRKTERGFTLDPLRRYQPIVILSFPFWLLCFVPPSTQVQFAFQLPPSEFGLLLSLVLQSDLVGYLDF